MATNTSILDFLGCLPRVDAMKFSIGPMNYGVFTLAETENDVDKKWVA